MHARKRGDPRAFACRERLSVLSADISLSVDVRNMVTITEGVEFDTVAREWRCKVRAQGKVSM